MIALSQGSVIAIKFLWGEHWGIVATDIYGRLTVISNRGQKGCVTEELWHEVVGTAECRIVDNLASQLPSYQIVERARSLIGHRYDFWSWNCQDFVFWALGLKPQSPQRDGVVGLFGLACLVMFIGVAGKRG